MSYLIVKLDDRDRCLGSGSVVAVGVECPDVNGLGSDETYWVDDCAVELSPGDRIRATITGIVTLEPSHVRSLT